MVGVMPERFALPSEFGAGQPVGLLLPIAFDRTAPRSRRGGHYLAAVARLHPGVTIDAASSEMANVLTGLKREYPDQHTQATGSSSCGRCATIRWDRRSLSC